MFKDVKSFISTLNTNTKNVTNGEQIKYYMTGKKKKDALNIKEINATITGNILLNI